MILPLFIKVFCCLYHRWGYVYISQLIPFSPNAPICSTHT
nr:MAG TPA: hypothetical protein [Caudoviricetes sp.]